MRVMIDTNVIISGVLFPILDLLSSLKMLSKIIQWFYAPIL